MRLHNARQQRKMPDRQLPSLLQFRLRLQYSMEYICQPLRASEMFCYKIKDSLHNMESDVLISHQFDSHFCQQSYDLFF